MKIEKLLINAVVLIIIVTTLIIGSCCIHVDYRIAQAIKAGSDPILARAAFSNTDGTYERIVHIANKER